jgi:hypothetical protein
VDLDQLDEAVDAVGFNYALADRGRSPPDDLVLKDSYDAGYNAGVWVSDGG